MLKFPQLSHVGSAVRGGVLVLGLVAGLAAPAVGLAAPVNTAVVSVVPASQTVPLGQTFSVSVNVDTGSPTLGFQFGLTFDPSKVHVNSITRGTFLDDYATTIGNGAFVFAQPWTIDNTAGTISIGGAAIINGGANPGPMGTGTLATISLTAQNSNGSSALTLTGATVNGIDPANTTVNNGSVITGSVPLADLSILSPATVADASDPTKFNVTFQVRNGGTLDAPASVTGVTVSGATPGSQTVATPAITAGSTSATLTAGPFSLGGTLANVTITADSTGVVTESNEANNTATTAYQHAAISSTANTPIDATLGAFLQITAPGAISGFVLTPGTTNHAGGGAGDVLNVKANVDWSVTVSGDNGGRLTEFDGTAYTTPLNSLLQALGVHQDSQPNVTLSGSPQQFVSGTGAGSDPQTGTNFTVAYDQFVGFNDKATGAGHTYHIVLTWTGSGTI
jgi:hypothetical protein